MSALRWSLYWLLTGLAFAVLVAGLAGAYLILTGTP